MREQTMDVSVIIPMHNGGEHIQEQLDALAAQRTDLRWEVIVGDNRSTDGSPEAVRARAATFPVSLRVVDASRVQGASHARNAAAAAATGEVLAMCDADDHVAPDWVEQAWRAVHEIAPVVTGKIRILEEPFSPVGRLLNPHILHGRGILSGNAAMRRDAFAQVGGFDESLPPYGVEDSDLSSRLLAAGYLIGPAPDMLLYFRETCGIRPKMRKIYMSGQAEAVLWARRGEAVGTPLTERILLGQLAALPVDAVATVRRRGVRTIPKWLLREAAVRTGRWTGYRTWVKTGRAGEARLPFADGGWAARR